MKKGTGVFRYTEEKIDVCDFCSKSLEGSEITMNFRWTDGYDHYGDVVEVCSTDCLVKELKTRSRDFVFHGGNPSISLIMPPGEMEDLLNAALGTIFPD